MNTRQPIQPADTAVVLSASFSSSRNRFVAGLSTGIRVFRTDNCLTTYGPSVDRMLNGSPTTASTAIAEVLDDRYIAYVAGGKTSRGSRNVVVFWDCLQEQEVTRFDFYEPVLGIRLSSRSMIVILQERTVVFEFQQLQRTQQPSPPPENQGEDSQGAPTVTDDTSKLRGANKVKAIYPTTANPFALACLSNDLLVLPAQSNGQVQLIPLSGGSKRVLPAHNTSLRQVSLSPSGTLVATASEQGTLIRVFDTKTLEQLAEFRRGVEKAILFSIAFSPSERWLACTSDKGTLHVFDLRPPPPTEPQTSHPAKPQTHHRKPQSTATHRLSSNGAPSAINHDVLSALSGRSSPSAASNPVGPGYQGSVQEYYGLRAPPASSSPQTSGAGVSAMSAFRSSAFAPRIMKDVRSVASAPFHIGDDVPHWQGGASYSWTTAPNGVRKRIKNPVPALPAEPSGRPPKGILAFAPGTKGDGDEQRAALYVLAGGSDARWEMFDLAPKGGGAWELVKRGYRKFLTRQYAD